MALVAAMAACARAVSVETGPQPASEVALRVTNNLSQAVNVYISRGTSDVFMKQIGGNTVEWVPVQGFAAGSNVTLKARTVDGARTYTRDNVVLGSSVEWTVP